MKKITNSLLFSFSLILSGCQSLPFMDSPEVYVMESLANEQCRYRQSFADQYKDFGIRQFEVYCGKWEHPSGHVFEVPVTGRDVSLKQWASSGAWREWLDSQMICESGSDTTMIEGFNVHILSCKLRNGNWPYMAGVVKAGDSIYLADGIPTIMPVVEATIGQLSGEFVRPTKMTADTRSKALQRVRSFIKGPIYGSRELMEYYRLMSAGQFYNSIKDHTTAAQRYRAALRLHEQILGEDNMGLVDPLMHLALEVSNQGNFSRAGVLFKRAGSLAQKSPDQSDLARYLSYRALHAANRRNFKEALELAHRATTIRKNLLKNLSQAGDATINLDNQQRVDFAVFSQIENPTVVDVVQSLYIEASMLVRLNQPSEAEKVLREAIEILQLAPEAPPSWKPEIENLIARLAHEKGAQEERSEHLETATTLWESFAPGERPSAINFLELGEALQVQGRSDEALEAFRHAVKLVKSRNGSLSYQQLLPYFTTVLSLSEQRPDERKRLHAELFTAGQLIRSKLTTQNIALAVARLAAEQDGAGKVIREFQDAQDQRFLLNQAYEAEMAKLAGEQQAETLETLKTRLSDLESRLKTLSVQVQAAFPRYNQLVDSAIDADRVMALLGPEEALLQVLLGNDDGMVFVVSNQKVTAVPIDISRQEAQKIVDQLRAGLDPMMGQLKKFDVDSAYLLYQRLFNSITGEISGKHLITVSSGAFLSLPFGVLVTEKPTEVKSQDYSQIAFLGKISSISLLPSVRSFVALRDDAGSSMAEKAFIGFGDFVPITDSVVNQLNLSRSGGCQERSEQLPSYHETRANFIPLPATKLELEKVSDIFPEQDVDFSLGSDFTDQAVKNMPLQNYQVLYFATHGLLPNDLECLPQPSLVTSPPKILQDKDDGFLDMEEILKLNLDADLVVLSACNTGGPDRKGGENLTGLARAFFFAGARSLLVSHWPAADEATVELMTGIFDQMQQNPDAGLATSLQHVQQDFLTSPKAAGKNYTHPFFWANFTLVGDGKKGLKLIGQKERRFSE